MKTAIKTLLIYLLGSFTLTFGQQTWTLDQCIDYALANNLTVQDLNLRANARKESYSQSYREFLPSLRGQSNYNIQYGRSVDPNTNAIIGTNFFSNNYSINASADIFRGFQRSNNIKATKFLLEAAKEDIIQEEYFLAFRVMTAFYDVLFFEEQLKISTEQVDISRNQYKFIQRQIELGLKAGTDLYEAEAVLIADQLVLTQNENNLQAAELALIQEMNLQNATEIEIRNISSEPLQIRKEQEIHPDSIYRTALSFMPGIEAQRLRIRAEEKHLEITKGRLYPSISLSAGYGTGFYETRLNASGEIIPFGNQIRDNANLFVGLSLGIPIIDRWRIRSDINQQKILISQSVNENKIRKLELQKTINQLIQDYEASQSEYIQTNQSETARKLAFEVAQKKYEKGLISIIELNRAKNQYAMSQNENLQIKLRLKVQKKTLDFYRGKPTFNIQ